MKTKMIPPFIMLLAGAITSIITFKMHYEMKNALLVLLAVLLVFYIVGCFIKKMFDSFEKANTKEETNEEGEVISKQMEDGEKPEEEAETPQT